MATTAIGDPDDFFPGGAEDGHDLVDVWAKFVGIKMGHDFIENARGTVLDGANHIE
jgi:hypothetical protein